jgi:hypothetical protein
LRDVAAAVSYLSDLRVGENAQVEIDRFFCVIIKPKEGRNFIYILSLYFIIVIASWIVILSYVAIGII